MKERLLRLLRWSERYTKTDMVYLASSNFWLHSTSWLVALCSFLLYIVFGNVLSIEVYGTYQYLISLGALVGAFTLTGMNGAVSRAVAQGFEGSYRRAISVQLRWGIVPLLGAWAVGAFYLLHGNSTIGIGLLLLGVFIPLNTALNTYGAYLAAKADFKRNFSYSLLVNLPYYIGVALVAVSLPTALALLAAYLVTQAIGYAAAHRRTLKVYNPNYKEDPGAMRYGRHLSIMNFIGAAAAQIDNVLVFNMLGPAQLALYSFATAVPDRLNIFRLLGVSAFPKFANRTPQEVASSLRRKVLLSVIIAAAVALIYAVAAPLFFSIFFPKYHEAVPFSQVYALTIIAGLSPLFTAALTAHRRIKALYSYNAAVPILQLGAQIAGLLLAGLWGLILARVASALIASLASWLLIAPRGHLLQQVAAERPSESL